MSDRTNQVQLVSIKSNDLSHFEIKTFMRSNVDYIKDQESFVKKLNLFHLSLKQEDINLSLSIL